MRVYLDHNATSPLKPAVKSAVLNALDLQGNASSVHGFGREVRLKIESAREQLAKAINVKPSMVIFTSGATEANNMILNVAPVERVLVSAIEHPSILNARSDIEIIPVTRDGVIDLTALEKMLMNDPCPALVNVMLVNNETGVIQPVREVVEIARKYNALVHTDAVQALGKIPVNVRELGVDFMSLSSHKIGGPQGMGALIAFTCLDLPAFIKGGAQEQKRRAGTENLAGIAGFGVAAELAVSDLADYQHLKNMRDKIETHIKMKCPDTVIFGIDAPRVVNTSMIALPGIGAETQMIALDLAGIAVSNGSACSSGTVKASHVLTAMGATDDTASSCIRISLGWNTLDADIDAFLIGWDQMFDRIKSKIKKAS